MAQVRALSGNLELQPITRNVLALAESQLEQVEAQAMRYRKRQDMPRNGRRHPMAWASRSW
jgi:hypothetical protein